MAPTDPDRRRAPTIARRLVMTGRVQGVGFRPFVYRLAHAHGLSGWVLNAVGEVEILAQGPADALDAFARDLVGRAPPLARPHLARIEDETTQALEEFAIRASREDAEPRIHVPPDQFACDECLAELRDPNARRYRYPFVNCTQCGPRYTIIERMPYDRPNTTMAGFALCEACRAEYEDPLDRRFHAQPLACPACGPHLTWRTHDESVDDTESALARMIEHVRAGGIVAVRGIGGYHLMCDAASEDAVARLRERKRRPDKPLAVMVALDGTDGLDAVRALADPDDDEAAQLIDPMRPIVLVRRRRDAPLAPSIAPGLDETGLMLPYSPLHELILQGVGGPLVATSGNISGEPVITDPGEAEERLDGIVDGFLHHDRPIRRPADDPVLRAGAGRVCPLRLGRGCAPLELTLPRPISRPILAVGAHLKNTIALAWDDRVVVSPHIGDLDSPRSRAVFEQVLGDLQHLYGVRAETVVCDAHPDYANTRWAERAGLPCTRVYHHHAHASALAGEHGLDDEMLVFAWDGTGYGEDGTVWGGETLLGRPGQWRRVGSLRPFRLPGGERAAREPWRSAMALAWELERGAPIEVPGADLGLLHTAWRKGINTPTSSAAGRVLDAMAALAGVCTHASHEGQGPMRLEALVRERAEPTPLPMMRDANGVWRTDWAPLVDVAADAGTPVATRAAHVHASLAQAIVEQARRVRESDGVTRVGLTGGVFQNRVLTEQAAEDLAADGFEVYLHRLVPCNDGGINYGQVIEAMARNDG